MGAVLGARYRNLSVVILPFNEVSEQFALEEGEGNRSLAYWRMVHENYFRCSEQVVAALFPCGVVITMPSEVSLTKQRCLEV